jgi:hypothetical protein
MYNLCLEFLVCDVMCVQFELCYNVMFCRNLIYTFCTACLIKLGKNMLRKLLTGVMFQSLYRDREEIYRPMAGSFTNMT